MKKIFAIVFIGVLMNCQTENKKFMSKQITENNFTKINDSIFKDFDLFSFKPVYNSDDLNLDRSYLKIKKDKDQLELLLFFDKKERKMILNKDKSGFYSHIQSFEEGYIKEYLYTVYSESKIITFILSRKGDDTLMSLSGYRILFQIDDKKQRELIFKFEKEKKVLYFTEIEYNKIINNDENIGYESEYIYYFDYINKKCYKYFNEKDRNELVLENVYFIYNSKSAASPFYIYWKIL